VTVLGLTSGVETAWWIALGIGLVVALVVAALLEVLRRTVEEVRRGADDVLSMGGRLAQNTWTVQLLEITRRRGLELLAEVEEHVPKKGGDS
jgi:hypothetical protein